MVSRFKGAIIVVSVVLLSFLNIATMQLLIDASASNVVQQPSMQWSKTYRPNLGLSLDQTSDNGYIIAGTTTTGFHDSLTFSTYVIKTNSLGETLWIKQFGDNFTGPLTPNMYNRNK